MTDKQDVTILVVEDELVTRKSFVLFLGSKGFKIIEAENGRMGLEVFRKEKPRLILLDLRMPIMDGLEVLPFLKEESPDTPVIVISGTEKITDAIEALHRGAWDYVLKPIKDMTVLYHAVEKALERARLIQENKRYREHLESAIQERTKELILANQNLTREISERQRIEEALRESEKAYKAIFNAVTAALFICDESGSIVEANIPASHTYESHSPKLNGLPMKSFLHPDYIAKFERLLDKTKTKGHYRCELVSQGKNGNKIVNEVVATEVEYKGIKHLLLAFHDITERKEAEEKERIHQQQLIQADKMASLGILVSGVAHEINNPNNFIMVNAPIVAKICKTVEPILEDHFQAHGDFYLAPRIRYSEMKENISGIISGILEGSQRIDHFVKELKNFSRPTPATMEPGIDVNSVIKAAITLLANLIKNCTLRFQTQLDETIPCIKGNFHRLEQVVINLLENSCQALEHKDQSIIVSTHFNPVAQQVIIRVTDEGAGMTEDTMDKIKNPFFSTKRDSGGTGLGLSISSKIVEDHRGSLEFESIPGKGTTASVLLPVNPGTAPQIPSEEGE